MTHEAIYKSEAGEQAVMAMYDAALSHWPVPYETMLLPTRHGDTFVIASGDVSAPPLILLHGAGSNSAIWAGDTAAYSRHYRVYAVDLIGEPGKSAPNRPAWEGAAYAEWLEDVFNGLHIEQAVVVGISQGAWTALKFSVVNPERIEKLILICPGGIIPDRPSFLIRAIGLSLLGQWGTRRLIRALFGAQPVPEGVEDTVALVMGNFKGQFGVLPIFTDAELRRLTMPTLLLGGGRDVMRDLPKIAARLRGLLPHLEVTIFPAAGHVVLNTVGTVLDFLQAAHAPQSEPALN